MKAFVLKDFGGADQLVPTTIETPVMKADEVLVQVKAISLNPVDAKTRSGKGMAGRLKELPTIILGWDVSGVVTEVGENVTKFKKNDEVFGMVNFPGHGQAYAEYVAAPAAHLALKPSNITHEEAAAATLAALTAYQAFVHKASVTPGQKLLIHAAAGGVGHFAVQLAKHLGAYVIGTSSAANKKFVLSLGADEHIDYQTQRFEDEVQDVDLVLDALGGANIARSLEVIKPGGTLITIPSGLADTVAEQAKAKNVNGFFFLVQSSGDDMQQLATLLEQGIIKPHVSRTFPFQDLPQASAQIESGKTKGKLVVTV
ncbi:NADP-dependent oxidoreductase [Adhaeribacter pallidiroseus]|uniref:NADPH:quinone reductase n=1 Tax=Adhaeribacter pallidiroseus TaxID=2072847 RepID=A0A369QMN7_9BACT|nr:NADP-dependent oxidoreductase [Adhaeribacter pallidiroseus]RDC66193.1 NADPH:quinone reductase [Adhaeribacter pallidiroseus]